MEDDSPEGGVLRRRSEGSIKARHISLVSARARREACFLSGAKAGGGWLAWIITRSWHRILDERTPYASMRS